uniref:NADH-ubiquinone oxidoreductase chain 6 n=1 Tax=Procecidochares utilis TaxID=716600 RepID=M1Q9F1_9MUSC|nr:NADH dehydrogenase subunit 6 [Procecidochares utilis]AGG10669.1 NADH dehydrogenase subunit 6 [Procecidochares utilis]UXG57165.1 NADH dehydrogenase subunit 6 [Procecidochares utilis]
MIQMTLSSTMLITSLIFIQMNHPLAMGLMLLIQTLQISMLTGMIYKTFWFSYILFLIFMGGILVLFIYVTSLASNEMFSMSMKLMFICLFMLFIMIIMSLMMDKIMTSFFIQNNEMKSIYNLNSFIMENSTTLNKLYNYPTNLLTIMLMNYLLITLIVVVKITNLFYGPLRFMN